MALEDQVLSGLGGLTLSDEAREQYRQALMARARAEIERQSGNQARAINERAFGRGFGLSSVNAQMQAENNRLREETLTKAGTDADVAARQAQAAALGQAAAYVLALKRQGLAEGQTANQESQFRRQLHAASGARQAGMLQSGLAGLVGAAGRAGGNIFGEDIRRAVRGAAGSDQWGRGGTPPYAGGNADVLRDEGPASPEDLAAPTVSDLPEAEGAAPLYDFGANEMDLGALPTSVADFTFPDWTEGVMGLEDLIQNPWDQWVY